MRIVHLTTFDSGDGVSVAVSRLHKGLLRLGHESTMFVAESRTDVDDPTVMIFMPPTDLRSRLRRRFRREQVARSFARYQNSRPDGYETFSDDRSPHGADLLSQLPSCDVINVHAMLGFVDYRAFFAAVPRHTPVVRTLHDMSFFTGGCHYDAGCGKYLQRCGACPQLGSIETEDLSRQIWHRKHSAFKAVDPGRLHLVTPSRWLAQEAKRSTLLRDFPCTVISHGVDTESFCPRDRRLAREVLGVPQDACVVLFIAEPITRRAKGFALLAEALKGLAHLPNLFLISVGSGKPPVEVLLPHLHLGSIRIERLLSLIYNAADIFAIPSLQEAFGLTALEATACGTPVVGFAVGGIPDIVQSGITGLLVPAQDVKALRIAIGDLLEDPRRRAEMAANARRVAVQKYTLEVQARRYIELYEAMIGNHTAHNGRVQISVSESATAR